jgi:hypothetical protein
MGEAFFVNQLQKEEGEQVIAGGELVGMGIVCLLNQMGEVQRVEKWEEQEEAPISRGNPGGGGRF